MLTGLTRVGEIQSYSVTEGEHIVPQDGMLYYRGIDCRELVKGSEGRRFAFEETAYLLLFGELPTAAQLEAFCRQLASYRTLPTNFFRDVIMKAPPRDLMNTMQRGILTLFCYDDKPNDIGLENVLRQCLQLMSNMPVLAIYAYQAWRFSQGESLFIHVPKPELSTAENFLRMLREDCGYTDLEARTLDVALILHADNGGGNNSTFTNVVIASTGTDIYSTVCGGIGSLKGPRHGGANIKVAEMMDAVLAETGGYDADDKKIRQAVEKLMAGELYDRSGLVYGFGHAVYTVSDPRAEVLRACCMEVAKEQKHTRELDFYIRFERIAKEVMEEIKGKALPTNVDFYSGFAYGMLRIPRDLYTPLFVCSRVVGWVAHNIENKLYDGRIMRPATKYVGDNMDYVPMSER